MNISGTTPGGRGLFTRINDELRRHARSLGANFVSNPIWNVLGLRHLITVHPLGGCPMGEDHLHGATDEFGRVFAQDGSIHEGLFVADGALLPSATGVNPFMTISALSERIAERKIQEMQGNPYPAPAARVSFAGLDPIEMTRASESELERIFRRTTTLGIDGMLNKGGAPEIDVAATDCPQRPILEGILPARSHSEHDVVGDLHRVSKNSSARKESGTPGSPATRTGGSARAIAGRDHAYQIGRHARRGQVYPAALPRSAMAGFLRHLQAGQS